MKGFSLRSNKPSIKPPEIKKRGVLGLGDEESEDEDEGKNLNQKIISIDEKGVIEGNKKAKEKKELIIKPVANRNWREEAYIRQGVGIIQSGREEEKENEQKIHFGLNTIRDAKKDKEEEEEVTEDKEVSEGDKKVGESINEDVKYALPIQHHPPFDDDDDDDYQEPLKTEEDAYKDDIISRPDAPDLAAYERVPVEEFGAALLRGMGWKGPEKEDEDEDEYEIKEGLLKKRRAFLGLGAKPIETGLDELGSWGAGSTKKSSKIERTYVPLIKVNKETGEQIKEEDEEEIRGGRERETDKDKSKSYELVGDERRIKEERRYRESSYKSSRSSRDVSRSDREGSERRDSYKDRDRYRDRDRDRDRAKNSDRDRGSNRDRERKRDSDRYRDRYRDSRDSDRDKYGRDNRDVDRGGHRRKDTDSNRTRTNYR